MKYKFSSSVTRGGDIVNPDHIEINVDAQCVTCYKRKYLIGKDLITFNIKNISSVTINKKIISADITICGRGKDSVTMNNFTKGDANKIKSIINNLINSK
jgi:hypothetical protein